MKIDLPLQPGIPAAFPPAARFVDFDLCPPMRNGRPDLRQFGL